MICLLLNGKIKGKSEYKSSILKLTCELLCNDYRVDALSISFLIFRGIILQSLKTFGLF